MLSEFCEVYDGTRRFLSNILNAHFLKPEKKITTFIQQVCKSCIFT